MGCPNLSLCWPCLGWKYLGWPDLCLGGRKWWFGVWVAVDWCLGGWVGVWVGRICVRVAGSMVVWCLGGCGLVFRWLGWCLAGNGGLVLVFLVFFFKILFDLNSYKFLFLFLF